MTDSVPDSGTSQRRLAIVALRLALAAESLVQARQLEMRGAQRFDRQRRFQVTLRLAPQFVLQAEPAEHQQQARIARLALEPGFGAGDARQQVAAAALAIEFGHRRIPLRIEPAFEQLLRGVRVVGGAQRARRGFRDTPVALFVIGQPIQYLASATRSSSRACRLARLARRLIGSASSADKARCFSSWRARRSISSDSPRACATRSDRRSAAMWRWPLARSSFEALARFIELARLQGDLGFGHQPRGAKSRVVFARAVEPQALARLVAQGTGGTRPPAVPSVPATRRNRRQPARA